ncbi:MAG: hypothetical protein ACLQVY_30650 [Limisphaerales bacterium]
MKTDSKIVFGDFQTPPTLAQEVCAFLKRRGIKPEVVLEPACGIGSFLLAGAASFPKARLFGWDINPDHVENTRRSLAGVGALGRATLVVGDFFAQEWAKEIRGLKGQLLVLGNFPWVTNSTVSSLNGANIPLKENFQGFRGMAARTGKSNFDISEWMLIQVLKSLRGRQATIAMLCKTATARKLLRFGWQNDGRISHPSLHRIDAKRYFGASVDACLLFLQTGNAGLPEAAVFETLEAENPFRVLGLAGQDLVSDIRAYQNLQHLEGLCPYQWRSGVKHDCASDILNSERWLEFLSSLLFEDSKRPVTVELLQRLNLGAIAEESQHLEKWMAARVHVGFHAEELQPEFIMERPLRG